MARYVLIDNASGYIWGDTADIGGKLLPLGSSDDDIVAACRAVDEDAGASARQYEILGRNRAALAANETGYLVYRTDVRGSEQVTVVDDGQDQEMIDAVTNYCDLVAVVKCRDESPQ